MKYANQHLKHASRWMTAALVLITGVATQSAVFGQPDPNNAPKADNPQAQAQPPRPDPAAMEARFREWRAQMVRQGLTAAGFADNAVQDAIVAHLNAQDESRRVVHAAWLKLFAAVREGAVADEQLAALMAEYSATLEAEKARQKTAETALEEKVKYSQNLRLKAALVLLGAVGEGPSPFTSGPLMGAIAGRMANAPQPNAGQAAPGQANKDQAKDDQAKDDQAKDDQKAPE